MDVSFSTSLDSGGASQCLGVALACMAIEAGLCTTVVCGYGRNSWTRTRSPDARMRVSLVPDSQRPREFGPEFGLIGATAVHALGARRHMHEYGTTKEQLGAVAVTFRDHASRNPEAQMHEPLTLDEYLAARPIVEPFGLYDCSLVTDGAGAVVVTSAERAATLPRPPVYVLGCGSAGNLRGWFVDDHAVSTAARAERRGRVPDGGPRSGGHRHGATLRLLHLHGRGAARGLRLLHEGRRRRVRGLGGYRHGRIAAGNTSGGQLSEGHVEGMLQIVEGVRQLRRDLPPKRQVEEVETALVSGHGGNAVCHSTLILGREAP